MLCYAARILLDGLEVYLRAHRLDCKAMYLHCLSTNAPARVCFV